MMAIKDLEKMTIALSKVHLEAKRRGMGKGKGGNGTMKCPICGKQLSFTVAPLNGHMWGRCSTKGCISWVE